MLTDIVKLDVSSTDRARPPYAGMRVYHREFPELRVEGGSLVEAVDRLAGELVRTLEFTCETRLRVPIEEALQDVRCYADSLRSVGPKANAEWNPVSKPPRAASHRGEILR